MDLGRATSPQGALGSPGLSHAHRLWLSLGISHRVASRHVNGHTRKWPSGWYRAGSPRLLFLTWPIYHTESDVHYGCPGPPTHRHYPGPALRGPRQLGLWAVASCSTKEATLPQATGAAGSTGCTRALSAVDIPYCSPPQPPQPRRRDWEHCPKSLRPGWPFILSF